MLKRGTVTEVTKLNICLEYLCLFADNMVSKGTRLYSILHHRCPQCHNGKLYLGKAYSKEFGKMPERCDHCGLRYEQEPSFFSGAMYVSYALQVAIFTTVYVALRVLFNPPMEAYLYTTIAAAVVLFPVTFRLSRAIYLNFFIGYKEECDHHRFVSNKDTTLLTKSRAPHD